MVKKIFKNIVKYMCLFVVGGLVYMAMEIAWRQWTHWTSFMMGGIAIIFAGLLNEIFTFELPITSQCTISGIFITLMEYTVGSIFNTDYSAWSYVGIPFNIDGQVCLGASILWCILSLIAIVLDDWIRYKFFDEEEPYYFDLF